MRLWSAEGVIQISTSNSLSTKRERTMRKLRTWTTCAVVALALLLPRFASAETISSWNTIDGKTLTLGDKAFTLTSFSENVGAVTVALTPSLVPNAYTLTLSGAFPAGDFDGFVNYDVQITDPNFHFTAVRLDSQTDGLGITVTKEITGPDIVGTVTVTSLNGSEVTKAISGQLIHVHETFHVEGGLGALQTTLDTYAQAPEPGSLVLLCTGLASFGGIGWMKKRKAKVDAA
jgi:hypothetical protein